MAKEVDCGSDGVRKEVRKEVSANPFAHPTRAAVFRRLTLLWPFTIGYSPLHQSFHLLSQNGHLKSTQSMRVTSNGENGGQRGRIRSVIAEGREKDRCGVSSTPFRPLPSLFAALSLCAKVRLSFRIPPTPLPFSHASLVGAFLSAGSPYLRFLLFSLHVLSHSTVAHGLHQAMSARKSDVERGLEVECRIAGRADVTRGCQMAASHFLHTSVRTPSPSLTLLCLSHVPCRFSLPPHPASSIPLRLALHGLPSTGACFVTPRSTMKYLMKKEECNGDSVGSWATRECLGRPLSHAPKRLPSDPLVSHS
ncbi:hypothetical protein BT69DRAFT_1349421 [Atractiella rhizophila]|nr:hypothetical protein BT69DRAFT_1349421 [Atractiella rhizophila]